MGGLVTHLSAGIIGAVLIYFLFYKLKSKERVIYGLIFIFGNILPDLIDFGILGIQMGSLNPRVIMTNPLFDSFARFGHTFGNWAIIAVAFWCVMFLIYEFGKIKKKTLIVMITSTILILVAILIHLKIDMLVLEMHWWL